VTKAERKAAGLCHDCSEPARPGKTRCEACAALAREVRRDSYVRKEGRAESTCSYCNALGHNRRTCDAWHAACAKVGEVEALMRARSLEPLTAKNPFAWEVQAQTRTRLVQVFEYIATLPPSKASAELAIKAAKAALEYV
jgi:hypothetical protein